MVWFYLVSLLPLYLLVRRYQQFGLHSAYFLFNWVIVSASVMVSSLANVDLVELGTTAEINFAAVVFNLSLAWMLLCSAFTYGKLELIRAKLPPKGRGSTNKFERRLFGALVIASTVVAVLSLLPVPPVATGTSVSEFLATLNPIQRFSFVSLAIAALPLSSLARRNFLSRQWRAARSGAVCLVPAAVWMLAGEKMGYLLFVLFCSALPWLQRPIGSARLKLMIAAAVLASLALTLLQYGMRGDNPLLFLGARAAMQGQLWYYFYLEAPLAQSFSVGARFLLGLGGVDTLRAMMEMAMPTQLFLEYDTAVMTGSHMPALLYGLGWGGFPIALALTGALFGLATTLLRLAVQTEYVLLSYLIVASFVFPGIEVWVAGNFSRLVTLPPTFLLFAVACVPLVLTRVTFRMGRRHRAAPSLDNPALDAS